MIRSADSWPGLTWYEATTPPVKFDRLAGRQDCRVAVVGGGLAGISTALGLVERGQPEVAVIEAHEPGAGASGRNGGFVFSGYSLDNESLVDQLGAARARTMHGWTREAVALIRSRIDHYGIDCQTNDAGVLLADWFDVDTKLEQFARRMNEQIGFRLEPVGRTAMSGFVRSRRYGSGLFEPGSFHFNPLAHIHGIADAVRKGGGRVLAHSPVRSIRRSNGRWRIESDDGRMDADEVVLATGGYDRRLCRSVQRALQPVATYIAVTEPLGEQMTDFLPRPVAVYDTRFAFDYFRPLPDTRLLWGGRISMAARRPSAIRRLMARDIRRVFPQLAGIRFEYAWGGWMSYARHEMPLLGRRPDGLWHALAFGGHGMATTTLAGEVMASALCGDGSRLQAFSRWPAAWAGGPLGRAWIQSLYWGLQWRDRLKAMRSTNQTRL